MKTINFERTYKKICSRGIDLDNILESSNAIYVYLDSKYIEAGPSATDSLKKKQFFYEYCDRFKKAVVKIIKANNEKYLIAGKFNNCSSYYHDWSDVKRLENFWVLRQLFHRNIARVFCFPEEHKILDFLIENGFRYLSNIYLYLPKSNLLLRFECHSQIIIYTTQVDETLRKLRHWIGNEFSFVRDEDFN